MTQAILPKERKKALPRRGGVKTEGVDSQVSVMMRRPDVEERLEVSFAVIEENGAEPFFRSEVASARLPCPRETCARPVADLQRGKDEWLGASQQHPCQTVNV